MIKQLLIAVTISLFATTLTLAKEEKTRAADNQQAKAEIDQFINELIKENGFTRATLDLWFEGAEANMTILKRIHRPAEASLAWHQYRKIFIQQERIDLGIVFWNKHLETLTRAEETYGVPAELIVGLIGVETKYGRIKGKLDVFNALYTLSFYFPRRSKFFRSELKAFLILAREQQWTAGKIKGSYAGAMGYGQFMPSSYRMYAVDFDGDGFINLLDNPVDAIGSVANYIKVHGWKTGESIVHRAYVKGNAYQALMQKGLKPKKTVADFIQAGVTIDDDLNPTDKALLIDLKQKEMTEYWLGKHNFYVISRYNPRKLYTMAVIQLSELIGAQYRAKEGL